MHVLEALSWVAATATLVVTIWKSLDDAQQGREQRNRELRWRQADAGKALNDEMRVH